MNQDLLRSIGIPDNENLACPNCGLCDIATTRREHHFTYGDGTDAVGLTAVVPVRTCLKCGFEYLDGDAEDAKHDAICRHLKVMTPAEVREIRKRHQLSRAEFARLSRLGEATIGRWERGVLVQNAAYDQFLHLLSFPENVAKLRQRDALSTRSTIPAPESKSTRRFRSLTGARLRDAEDAASRFSLIVNDEAA